MPLTPIAIQSANDLQTDKVWLELVTIDHPQLASLIRLVGNDVDITSNGRLFTAVGMKVPQPSDVEERPPQIEVLVSDIDQTVVVALRTITSQTTRRPDVTTELIIASEPNNILFALAWKLTEANITAGVMRLRLEFTDLIREPFPKDRFVPSLYPALYI